jgi:hypothetical protein
MTGDRQQPAGIIYSCSGPTYIEEAVSSARSSLRHNDVPHLIYASPVPAVPRDEPRLAFAPFTPSGNPFLDRIANMRRSPFERTIFLDSDTYVVDEIAHLLTLFDSYDAAAVHAPGYRGLADPEVPAAFHEFNCGVIAWRSNERTAAFLADWEATYAAWLREEPFPHAVDRIGDQPAFRHCAWKHGLAIAVLGPEYNFRITKPGTLVGKVRVLHGRHPRPEALAARLNKRPGPRNYSGSLRVLAGNLRQRDLFRPAASPHGDPRRVARSMMRVMLRRS